MKKIITLFVLVLTSTYLFASNFTNLNLTNKSNSNINSNSEKDFFFNPANISIENSNISYIETSFYNNLEMSNYLINPNFYYTKSLSSIIKTITDDDFNSKEFWKNKQNLINLLKENDQNFPFIDSTNPTDYQISQVNNYFNSIDFDSYNKANVYYMFNSFYNETSLIKNDSFLFKGNPHLFNLNFSNEKVFNKTAMGIIFSSSFYIPTEEKKGAVTFNLSLPIGKSFTFQKVIDFGFDCRPSLNLLSNFSSTNLFTSRNTNNFTPLFMDKMSWGYNILFDLGINYHIFDNLYCSCIIKDFSVLTQNWIFNSSSLVSFDFSSLEEIKNYSNFSYNLIFSLNYNFIIDNHKKGEINIETINLFKDDLFTNFDKKINIGYKYNIYKNTFLKVNYNNDNLYLGIEKNQSSFQIISRIFDFSSGYSFGFTTFISY